MCEGVCGCGGGVCGVRGGERILESLKFIVTITAIGKID